MGLLLAGIAAGTTAGQMSGVYTIDPARPPSSLNFRTFSAALQALRTQGVGGPVRFDVASTTFNESIVVHPVQNTSPASIVTFVATGSPAVLRAPGTANAIELAGAVNWLQFVNLQLTGYVAAGILFHRVVGEPCGPTDIEFVRCTVDDGGTSWPYVRALSIDVDVSNLNFTDCIFRASGEVVSTKADGLVFRRCEFDGKERAGALFRYVPYSQGASYSVLENCFFHGCSPAGDGVAVGTFNVLAHNTVVVSTSGAAFQEVSASRSWSRGPVLKNNILVNLGAGAALNLSTSYYTTISTATSDYNCIHAPSSVRPVLIGTLMQPTLGGSLAQFLQWPRQVRIAPGGATSCDANSVETDPGLGSLVSPFDIHLQTASPLIDRGTAALIPSYVPFTWQVWSDTDGQARTSPVDIGADELVNVLSWSGAGTIGSTVTFELDAQPDAGKPYEMASSLGAGPIPIDTRLLPLDLDVLAYFCVAGLAPSVFEGYVGLLDASGKATARLHIPGLLALVGLRIHTAFIVVDPGAPSSIGTISNPTVFTIR